MMPECVQMASWRLDILRAGPDLPAMDFLLSERFS